MGNPSHASEFPNDNVEISGGAIWICADLTGPATAELGAYEPVPSEPFVLFFDDGEGYVDAPSELAFANGTLAVAVHEQEPEMALEMSVEPLPEPNRPEPLPESDPYREPGPAPEAAAFARFEGAVVAALMAQGASRSAALVPRLLRLEPLPADALSKDVQLTLQSRGYLDGNSRYSEKYRDLCGAWSAVLRGSSQDFAACGTTTLDRFGADLLAALLAVPATRADELRRELRKAGIAAFGVLHAA